MTQYNMSGRFNIGGQGKNCGHGSGRGSLKGKYRSPKNNNNESDKKEMKFTPKIARKNQGFTYDTVKEHILQEIQTELTNGEDIVDNLQAGVDNGIKERKPTRLKAPKIKIEGDVTEVHDIITCLSGGQPDARLTDRQVRALHTRLQLILGQIKNGGNSKK